MRFINYLSGLTLPVLSRDAALFRCVRSSVQACVTSALSNNEYFVSLRSLLSVCLSVCPVLNSCYSYWIVCYYSYWIVCYYCYWIVCYYCYWIVCYYSYWIVCYYCYWIVCYYCYWIVCYYSYWIVCYYCYWIVC